MEHCGPLMEPMYLDSVEVIYEAVVLAVTVDSVRRAKRNKRKYKSLLFRSAK